MFRSEPDARFRATETSRPDPRHSGVSFVERRYFLATGPGRQEVEIAREIGEAVATGQRRRPQPLGHAAGRYWWMYRDRLFSSSDRLSRGAALRLIEGENGAVRRRPPAVAGPLRASRPPRATA